MEGLTFGEEKLLKKGTKRGICYSNELFIIYWVLARNTDYLAHCKHLYQYLMKGVLYHWTNRDHIYISA